MSMITLECDYDVKIGLDDGDLSARKTTAKQAAVKKA
jgi:hypothetical protein